jgi:hypothetical protein
VPLAGAPDVDALWATVAAVELVLDELPQAASNRLASTSRRAAPAVVRLLLLML